ncbi:hypothetical protein F4809DRAFT_661256 [Biscogniauxia mediterranea]|nr:hypothetical protein F4809DRAFT_661256 [Biscogniauxia mediterranea]
MCCGSDEDYYHGGQQDSQYHGAQRRRYDDEQAEKLARQREARIAAERYGWKNDRRPQQQHGGSRSNGGKLPPIQTPGTRDSYLDPGLNSQVVNMPDYMPYAPQAYDPRRPRQPNINNGNNNSNNSHRPGAGGAQHLPQQYSQQYNAFKPHRRAPAPPVAAQAQAPPPPYYHQQHPHPHPRQQQHQQQQQRPAIVRQQPRRTQPMTAPMVGGMRVPVRTNAERRAVAYGTAAPPMAQARAATVWHQQQRQGSVTASSDHGSDVDVRDHVVPEGYTVSPMSETFSPGLPGSYGRNLGAVHGRDGAF